MSGKSDRIQRLLNDEDLQQAFKDVKDALYQAFCNTSPSDGETLQDIRKRLHLLDSVEANLRVAIEDGHLEEFREKQQEQSKEGIK